MSATFPELPPANPAVDDPGHTDDHGKLVAALEWLRDNALPGVVSDTEPVNLPFGHLWVKPRRTQGQPEVLASGAASLPAGPLSVTLELEVPAGTTALYVGSFWTPTAPYGTVTLNDTPLTEYGRASSGSASTDRAVALFVVPSPPTGTVRITQAGSASIARAVIGVAVGGTAADTIAGSPLTDAGAGRTGSALTPDALPFIRFGTGRGAEPMVPVGEGTELEQIASGSTTRVAAAWVPSTGALASGGWNLGGAADATAIIGCAVIPA